LEQQRRGGQALRVWSRWAARRGPDGRQTGFLILEHDVGERSRVEERIRGAQKLESMAVLAGGVAHDFNNLLTGILGNASLLEHEVTPAGEPFLKQVIYGAEQAGNLTRQLMAYAGKGRSVAAEIDLGALARNTVGLLRASVPKTVQIRLDLDPEPPPVFADATQIQQVLMNLVINGSEAIGPNTPGTITVGAGLETVGENDDALPPGRYAALTVSDTGCGMDRDTVARIFDPFFTTKATGHGLGLSAVLGILRACGGRINVESQPGQGSVFRLSFPPCGEGHRRGRAHAYAGDLPCERRYNRA
jgi:signal transduction histidine kinase